MNKLSFLFIFLILSSSGCTEKNINVQDNSAIYDEFDRIIEQSNVDVDVINELSDKHDVARKEYNKHIDKYNGMNAIKQRMYRNTMEEEEEKYRAVARDNYLELKKVERHNEHALNYIDNNYDVLSKAYNIHELQTWFMDYQAQTETNIEIIGGNLGY